MITAHHATDAEFDQFDFTRLGEYTAVNATDETAVRMARLGAWFASRSLKDDMVTEHDLTCDLDIANPYATTFDALWDMLSEQDADSLRADLEADGYDGIALRDTEFDCTSYVAFDAAQITIVSRD